MIENSNSINNESNGNNEDKNNIENTNNDEIKSDKNEVEEGSVIESGGHYRTILREALSLLGSGLVERDVEVWHVLNLFLYLQ